MPVWGQIILGASAIILAVGVLWKKLNQFVAAASEMQRSVPVLREAMTQFEGSTEMFAVLRNIAAQFHADSGTTLRDVVNRLEDAAKENQLAAGVLQVNVETARRLAVQDRDQMAEAIGLIRGLLAGANIASAERAEMQSSITAASHAADVIAADLAESQDRARAVEADTSTSAGAAADAASVGPPVREVP